MNLLLSLLALAGLVAAVVWVKNRGYFQHVGCTCRRDLDGSQRHDD